MTRNRELAASRRMLRAGYRGFMHKAMQTGVLFAPIHCR